MTQRDLLIHRGDAGTERLRIVTALRLVGLDEAADFVARLPDCTDPREPEDEGC